MPILDLLFKPNELLPQKNVVYIWLKEVSLKMLANFDWQIV